MQESSIPIEVEASEGKEEMSLLVMRLMCMQDVLKPFTQVCVQYLKNVWSVQGS